MLHIISWILASLVAKNVNGFDRIVGGTAVTVDQYPFIVSISGGCGGSILRKEYPALILTAAHCAPAFNAPTSYVRLNADDIAGSNGDSVDSTISHYLIHPDYGKPYRASNDIALLWLEKDISSNNNLATVEIDPVSLGSECCNSGDNLQVIGYGTDCSGCGLTPTLEFVDVDYVNRAECHTKYPNVDDTMNCAAATDSDACQGDSGGPLIKTGTNKQVGIVSWGEECAHPNYPGVYNDVGVFYDWINQHKAIELGTFRIGNVDDLEAMEDIDTTTATSEQSQNSQQSNVTLSVAFWSIIGIISASALVFAVIWFINYSKKVKKRKENKVQQIASQDVDTFNTTILSKSSISANYNSM